MRINFCTSFCKDPSTYLSIWDNDLEIIVELGLSTEDLEVEGMVEGLPKDKIAQLSLPKDKIALLPFMEIALVIGS